MRDFDLSNKIRIIGIKPESKRKPIGKALRDNVWIKYIGNKTQGKCYCCKNKPIHFTDFEVGHNKAVAMGGKIILII